jgi:hypothetical protein
VLQLAGVAVARKLATIMHRMWLHGSEFRFAAAEAPADATMPMPAARAAA